MAAGTWGVERESVHLAMGTLSFCPARQGSASLEEGTSPSARMLMSHVPALLVNRRILVRAVLPVQRLDADSAVQVLFVAVPYPHRTDLTLMVECILHARGNELWKAAENVANTAETCRSVETSIDSCRERRRKPGKVTPGRRRWVGSASDCTSPGNRLGKGRSSRLR